MGTKYKSIDLSDFDFGSANFVYAASGDPARINIATVKRADKATSADHAIFLADDDVIVRAGNIDKDGSKDQGHFSRLIKGVNGEYFSEFPSLRT